MYLKLSGLKILFSSCLMLALAGCGNEAAQETEAVSNVDSLSQKAADSLYFSYNNGPVSPEFQRKWEVVVKGDSATGTIYNMDKVIWQSTHQLNKDSLKLFLLKLSNCQLKPMELSQNPPCVGNSSYQISFFQNGRGLQGDGFWCGAQPGGTVQGDLKSAAGLFIQLLPAMKTAVDTSLRGNSGI